MTISISFYLSLQPAGIAFLYANGVDVSEGGFWTLEHSVDEQIDVIATDPFHIRVELCAGEGQLCATLDDELVLTSVSESEV